MMTWFDVFAANRDKAVFSEVPSFSGRRPA